MPALPAAVPASPRDNGYLSARALVAEAGVPLPESRLVRTTDEARAAAATLGYPLVLKTLAREHKSDSGGVVLGIEGPAELDRAYESLARLGAECSLERQEAAEHGIELIVGVRRDPRFGPLVLVGLGGIYAELIRDTAVALAPVEPDEAERLLRSLRCAPILVGTRGRTPLDVRAAARAASALSHFAAARPDLQELEVNPLLIRPSGVVALDARVLSVQL
jgi:succinyl-CoA synthetase beta subunit